MYRISKLTARKISSFAECESGSAHQGVILFGAVGIAMAVLLAPLLNEATQSYAFNKAMGVDAMTTSSVTKSANKLRGPTRRRIRKSVLDFQ